ncbi:hypothetical protein KSP35_11875 [Aquihabitans sp. G128]|uniref:hypothetical protein n=1 Tax=Aquihabitans sp. G128 TaxID=2849779 RepID=UPI001C21B596|nr:hypothetical protein [Aquihabitans sp. G128]QXC59113.1 hypothetical protein KSP35_11875 [Aquihabitans sp. G128]
MLEFISSVVESLAWPLVIGFVIFRGRHFLKSIVDRLIGKAEGSVSMEAAGTKLQASWASPSIEARLEQVDEQIERPQGPATEHLQSAGLTMADSTQLTGLLAAFEECVSGWKAFTGVSTERVSIDLDDEQLEGRLVQHLGGLRGDLGDYVVAYGERVIGQAVRLARTVREPHVAGDPALLSDLGVLSGDVTAIGLSIIGMIDRAMTMATVAL